MKRKLRQWGAILGFGLGWGCAGSGPAATEGTFRSCAQARAAAIEDTGENPPNGRYTLYVDADAAKPWEAYCYGMNTDDPAEYLDVDPDRNYSQIATVGDLIESKYRRYRIDPATLEIDPLDGTFVVTTGDAAAALPGRAHVPAGWAQFGSAAANGGPLARARADLEETGFVFAASILENSAGFFCTTADGGDASDAAISIDAPLDGFTLTATNAVSSELTKTVADCDDLGASGVDLAAATARWPLAYVGTE